MKKIFTIFGSLLIIAIFLGLVLWTGQDQKLTNLAEKIKKSQEKSPEKMSKNLEKLATLKKGEFLKYEGRLVLGDMLKPTNNIPKKIEFINKADPEWEKKTLGYLNESSDYDRKISITKKDGLISLNKEYGLYLEQAVISFTQRDGSRGSFEALINSENGSIEIVISKNINESLEEPTIQRKNPDSSFNPFANNATEEERKEFNEGNTENILENLNQEKLANFDAQQYEDELIEQEKKLKEQSSNANFQKYVQEIKRQITTEE
jgi:hypothetical protein